MINMIKKINFLILITLIGCKTSSYRAEVDIKYSSKLKVDSKKDKFYVTYKGEKTLFNQKIIKEIKEALNEKGYILVKNEKDSNVQVVAEILNEEERRMVSQGRPIGFLNGLITAGSTSATEEIDTFSKLKVTIIKKDSKGKIGSAVESYIRVSREEFEKDTAPYAERLINLIEEGETKSRKTVYWKRNTQNS